MSLPRVFADSVALLALVLPVLLVWLWLWLPLLPHISPALEDGLEERFCTWEFVGDEDGDERQVDPREDIDVRREDTGGDEGVEGGDDDDEDNSDDCGVLVAVVAVAVATEAEALVRVAKATAAFSRMRVLTSGGRCERMFRMVSMAQKRMQNQRSGMLRLS